ncbi:hypothetical protein [Streptomyces sp. 8N706]|uniref:hypothetical protein n=1 Tax=Streptomyces sp. 8N706 TaxID=3457416 RepID=UPI003FD419A5
MKVHVAATLAAVAVLLSPTVAHAGLVRDDVNSPIVNQQQDIQVSDGLLGGLGWGGENTVTLNNFNNVGG